MKTRLEWLSEIEDPLENRFLAARNLYREACLHNPGTAPIRLGIMLKVDEKLQTVRRLISEVAQDRIKIAPLSPEHETRAAHLLDDLDSVMQDNAKADKAKSILSDFGKLVTEGL